MKKLFLILIAMLVMSSMIHYTVHVYADDYEQGETETYTYSESGYKDYLEEYDFKTPQIDPITIKGEDYIESHDSVSYNRTIENPTNASDIVLYTTDNGDVSFEVNVPEAGYYNIGVNYYPIEGKSSSIERSLFINGKTPFAGAENLIFHRIWADETEVQRDANGNDIKPRQKEAPIWRTVLLRDDLGYELEPYLFYFKEGVNTITFKSIKEPMLIDHLTIKSYTTFKSYEDQVNEYEKNNYKKTDGREVIIQGEDAVIKSSPTLYPISDRSSALTEPYHHAKIRLNTIGGYNWRVPGDWITWEFEVPEDGLYKISMRSKQNFNRGMFSSRAIYINGEIPFEEAANVPFKYTGNWDIETLSDANGDFLFYFEAGETHTITMEVTLGEFSEMTKEVEESVIKLNALYREIISYTGPTPDLYRDYQLEERIPNLVERLEEESERLKKVSQSIVDITGEKNEMTGILDGVTLQLDDFIENPREIHKRLKDFNNNMSALGTWILQVREQPLEIDYLSIHSEGMTYQANEGIFARLWHHIRSFIASFTNDYSSIGGNEDEGDERIEVWVSLGRDQANVIRQLIDETFTPETGIAVDMKLVNADVLLRATLAGKGPDVAMNVGNTIPVNYGLRNAVYDLSQFEDFEEVKGRFYDSAMVPYEFNGEYYALPEQQIFLMMFYRKDIFEELDIKVPQTWDDVIEITPDLQKHHLDFWLPVYPNLGIALPPNPVFTSLLYQNDGEFYKDNDMQSGFADESAMEAFSQWTKFYTAYKLPLQANFVNRFRNGEIPIGIEYYTMYNTLSVFAPEIRGEWEFAPIPGTIDYDDDGNEIIRRETTANGTGIIILKNSEKHEASWEYLKWWTSKETQVSFGREMEGVLGAAARYPTANVEALAELPWPTSHYEQLSEQWKWVKGVPEVAGGYLTGRHVDNAFREVTNEGSNPREVLYDYTLIINEEIDKKREEFGLPTYDD
ncbi:extracellular solute-binding protein [Haloplasma contractile]|uniref:Extracellular solute-binding protein family 1 n=1 Tax=Haloplasma contractile SSD-17B TaxID=1033810 RepID=F7PRE0_9MOLU|nr:extracellular solute-binding protein [Haloplasma contractile]ERJ11734.1 Extracellular solute-binding protein family 1 [Haloplasma contractile SSD-17B]